jgi:DsbC/DsbD-like thiol-disulfide interchange protein
VEWEKGTMKKTAGRLWVCAAFAAMCAVAAAAQVPQVVSARMLLGTDGVHAGAPAQAAVVAEVASGYHINDHHPSLDYLIPTQVKLDPSPRLTVDKLVYPKGELKSFAFSDTQLSVYQGKVTVGILLNVARGTPPGDYTLRGKFEYQACNDHACLPPASVPVSLTVKVVAHSVRLKPVDPQIFDRIKFD